MEKQIIVQADSWGVWIGADYADLDSEEAAAYQAALARFPEALPGQGRVLSLAQLAQVRAEVGRLLEYTPFDGSIPRAVIDREHESQYAESRDAAF